MSGSVGPKLVTSTAEIADAIRRAQKPPEPGRVVVLIGAGCSITAGIPGVATIASRMIREVAASFPDHPAGASDADLCAWLTGRGRLAPCLKAGASGEPTDATIDWFRVYDEMFRTQYKTPDDVRELFESLVEEAAGAINWAHLCLGELVKRRLIGTVLTTNFDQLVLTGIARAGILPVVCDGIESLNRIVATPRHPQLVELHGSRYTYVLRNRPDDVEAVRRNTQAVAAIQGLFQHAKTFVAVGYGGREDGVMDLLVQAARAFPDKNLFWVNHAPQPDDIGPKVRDFLATSRNGGLLPGQDADRFFLDLCAALRVGAPSAVSYPLDAVTRSIETLSRSKVTDPDIRSEIEAATARVERLRAYDASPEARDPVEHWVTRIREARLAGDLAKAYRLAHDAVGTASLRDLDPKLVEEAARSALAFGEVAPERKPLEDAIARLRFLVEQTPAVLPLATGVPEREGAPLDRADLLNNLGNALSVLGERESGTTRLQEAVEAYRAVLKDYTRARVPLDWAIVQNNLGTALSALGERESDTARLKEAVVAFRAALEERTRGKVPLSWAMTQNNLGNALLNLGEREIGTARIEEAVVAFLAALEERTRERVPLRWAMTQNNLGNALSKLGEREGGTARLAEAIEAYQAALEERTRERVPLRWAMTQNNLGVALSALGARESTTARLDDAVMAFRAALEERTRERVPLDWAATQDSLGMTMLRLAERAGGTALLEKAVATFRIALEERTRERVPLEWAFTQNNLGEALSALSERESGTERLEAAIIAYGAALQELTPERAAFDHARAAANLAQARSALAGRRTT